MTIIMELTSLQDLNKAVEKLNTLQSLDNKMSAWETTKSQAFLGYAAFNVIDKADGGKGPQLKKNNFNNRLIDEKFIKELTEAMNRGKQPFLPQNLITIGVKKEWLDTAQLLSNPSELSSTSYIHWTPLALTQEAVLFNGQHRLEANIRRVKDCISTYQAISTKSSNNLVQDQKLQSQLKLLEEKLQQEKYWGVELYDLGKLVITLCKYPSLCNLLDVIAQSELKDFVQFNLASNRQVLKTDTEEQSFIFILNLLRPHLPSQRDEVNQHLLQQGTKKSILKNLLTDKHHRDFMINLMEYEGFSHDRELKLSTLCTTWDSRTGVIGGVSSLISNQDSLLIVFIDCIEHL